MGAYSAYGPGPVTVSVAVTVSNRMEYLDLNDPIDFMIHGGYNCAFTSVVGFTYINGRVLVTTDSVVLDRIVVF